MQRADSLEKILVLGKTDNRRGMESQDEIVEWHNWLSGANYLPLSKLQEIVKDREAWRDAVHEVTELDMTEEPEIKLPTSSGSSKKWEFQKNI